VPRGAQSPLISTFVAVGLGVTATLPASADELDREEGVRSATVTIDECLRFIDTVPSAEECWRRTLTVCIDGMPSHGNQLEINFCAYFAREAWEARRAQAYEHALRVAPADARERIVKANQDWGVWKTGFCDHYEPKPGDGSMAPQLFNTCLGRHAAQWTLDLERFAWWYDR